jgi:hypothetical protein
VSLGEVGERGLGHLETLACSSVHASQVVGLHSWPGDVRDLLTELGWADIIEFDSLVAARGMEWLLPIGLTWPAAFLDFRITIGS